MRRSGRDFIGSNRVISKIKRQNYFSQKKQTRHLDVIANEVRQNHFHLTNLGLNYSWQAKWILALLLVSSAVSVAEFAKNVKQDNTSKPNIKPQDLSKKVAKHLSNEFTTKEKNFIAISVETIPAHDRQVVSTCIDLVSQRAKMLQQKDEGFIKIMSKQEIAKSPHANAGAQFEKPYDRKSAQKKITDSSIGAPVAIKINKNRFFEFSKEQAGAVLLHESVHCVEGMTEPEKQAEVANSQTNRAFSLFDVYNVIDDAAVKNYVSTYTEFSSKINNIISKLPSDETLMAAMDKGGSFCKDAKLDDYILKLGLECIKNGKYIKATSLNPNDLFRALDDDRFIQKDWAKIASDNTKNFPDRTMLAALGATYLRDFGDVALQSIEREITPRDKFSEMLAYLSEIPQSMLKVIDLKMSQTLNEAKLNLIKAADKKLEGPGDEVELYKVDAAGNKSMVRKVTMSEYKTLKKRDQSEL